MSSGDKISLADYAPVLPSVAEALGAEYERGAYEAAEEEFHQSGDRDRWWCLEGTHGALRIRFERYESYYFAELLGEDDATAKARAVLDLAAG